MDKEHKKEVIASLSRLLTPERWQRFQEIVQRRTRYITVVLEELAYDLNVSAALRSIECCGIQDVALIGRERVRQGITKGAHQWLTIKHYRQKQPVATTQCVSDLKSQGYRIVGTMPARGFLLPDLPLDQKIALVFGAERTGISTYIQEQADTFVSIPMYGFTESFNVAASVAIAVYELSQRVRSSSLPWQLASDEQLDLLYTWLQETVEKS
jgi:tRNA (guanosine-2'-O-)-methyltransferase